MVWDPVACCGDLGFPVVHQPGQLRELMAQAGPEGQLRVVYQPTAGDVVEHWEYVGWLCCAAQNLILLADEIDKVCTPGVPTIHSPYWKGNTRGPVLKEIVDYGRHRRIAMIAIARAPQSVWIRLRGQCERMLVFRMSNTCESTLR